MPPDGLKRPAYSVIVPAYNESAHLEDLYRRLKNVFKSLPGAHEIILIDDGSTDRTWQMIQAFHEQDSSIVGIRMMRNFGQQAAWRAGFEAARGEIVVTLDADLQNPPEEIPRLLAKLDEGYDVVSGVRKARQDSALRRLSSWCVNKMVSRMIGFPLHDIGCALRVHRRQVVDAFLKFEEKFQYFPAIFGMITHRIAELPVDHEPRRSGKSHYPWTLLLRLTLNLVTGHSHWIAPLFLAAGCLTALGAAAIGVLLCNGALLEAQSWMVLLFAAYLILLTVYWYFLGEYLVRIYRNSQRRPDYLIREELRRG